MYYSSIYGYPYAGYGYGVRYLKKREADPEKKDEKKAKVVFINTAMPYTTYGYPYVSPFYFKK